MSELCDRCGLSHPKPGFYADAWLWCSTAQKIEIERLRKIVIDVAGMASMLDDDPDKEYVEFALDRPTWDKCVAEFEKFHKDEPAHSLNCDMGVDCSCDLGRKK